ncbi:Flavinator of succinate dehydrogenase-domain-containing protein [Gloeopeniophorella convolvens]|nr:Flavinator of succinate dehydrogenase-domain-containing protein [Gloeopeniophorella convolvens]
MSTMSLLTTLARARLAHPLPARALFTTAARRLKDPWPLPHTPAHLAATATPTDAPPPAPLARPGEALETTRARLVYQSRKRGTLESDLLLSTFAREHLGAMGATELSEFDKLMDEPDWDIYYWATGKRAPPARWADSPLLERLRVHARNEGKVVRRMPDLH